MLENPYTHAYMKSALPFLADAFHDVHLSVRVAMCDLLLKVKQIKVSIRGWQSMCEEERVVDRMSDAEGMLRKTGL